MTTLREALKGKLTKTEMKLLRASFDVVGDIAIIEVPLQLKKKEKLIGKKLLSLLKNVKVVAVKEGGHIGTYRRQKLKVVAGEKRLITTHKESGISLKLDVEKCYYTQRLGSERLRIAKQIKKGERILVAGSGVGPYPLVLAKHSKAKEIVGVEINPIAHKYAMENVKANKLSQIKLVKGDVQNLKLGKFDRIIGAMPHVGANLVPTLLKYSKKGTILQVLDFAPEENLKDASKRLRMACKTKKRNCKILRIVKAGQHAVRMYRVSVDAKIV